MWSPLLSIRHFLLPTNAYCLDLQEIHASLGDDGLTFLHSSPKCLYALSVYVYPATEPLDRHLEAVRAEIIRANPDARPTKRILNLDQEHEGTGAHAGYLNDVNRLESFEAVSIYERAGWFIKYRTTIGPAEDLACEQRLRAAVAEMHVPKK